MKAMAINLIDQIARHIEFLGHGVMADAETDGDIYWGKMPDMPDACVCVFSTDSQYGGSDKGARVQIFVRGRNSKEAYERSQAIADDLVEFDGFLAGDGAHVFITPINISEGLGADAKQRELYSSNYLVKYCDY